MGNGDEYTADGFKFRGRGIIQLTGKDNYKRCSIGLYNDVRLLDAPDLLLQKEYALSSALWFWDVNNLANIDDIEKVTKIINGGQHGIKHRIELFNNVINLLH